MGVTLTDVLLFGKAQSDDVDNATLVIYRRNILRWSALGGYLDIIVKGVSPLNLPDAIANSLSYVKAFGGTEQSNLPDNYLQRQFIYMMDGSYLLTDIAPASNYKVEMDFQTTNVTAQSEYYLGVRDVSGGVEGLAIVKRPSSVGSTLAFDGFQANNRYFSSYVPTANTRYKYTYDNGTITLTKDNTVVVSHTFTPNSTVTSKLAINGFNDNGSVLTSPTGLYLYSFKVWNAQGELVMDLVPAVQKGTVPVVGFYDTVSGAFKTATAGTFAAGTEAVPSPDTPMNIVCNNGFLRFRKQSGLPDGYSLLVGLQINTALDIGYTPKNTTKIYTKWARTRDGVAQYVYRSDSSSSGTTNCTAYFGTSGSGNWRFGADTHLVPGPASGTVVESVQDSTGVDINGDFYAYTTPGTFTSTQTLKVGESNGAVEFYRITIYENNVMVRDLLPVQKTSDSTYGLFDMVNNVYYQTTARVTPVVANDPVEIYADGTVETIKDSLNNTATAEMLLKVGDYQDEQEILSGAVTRKVGVKVLDGTEDGWTKLANATLNVYRLPIVGAYRPSSTAPNLILCTHFLEDAQPNSDMGNKTAKLSYLTSDASNGVVMFKYQEITTLEDWKAYLTNQYANGTPVILLYCLKNSTTESVAGQTLQVTDGDNVLEITQASLTGLELEAKYKAAVTLTVQEVEDANLDNNVEVTIS